MVGSRQVVDVHVFECDLGVARLPLIRVLCVGDDFNLVRDSLNIILVRVRRQVQCTLVAKDEIISGNSRNISSY